MTHLFFAQATQELSFNTIGIAACLVLLGLIGAAQWVQIADRNKKQAREVSFVGTPVEKDEFDQFKADNKDNIDNLFSKIGGVERGVEARLRAEINLSNEDSKKSRKDMHAELTNVREDVARVTASQDLMNQRLVQMDGKIDRLVENNNRRPR